LEFIPDVALNGDPGHNDSDPSEEVNLNSSTSFSDPLAGPAKRNAPAWSKSIPVSPMQSSQPVGIGEPSKGEPALSVSVPSPPTLYIRI